MHFYINILNMSDGRTYTKIGISSDYYNRIRKYRYSGIKIIDCKNVMLLHCTDEASAYALESFARYYFIQRGYRFIPNDRFEGQVSKSDIVKMLTAYGFFKSIS